jgi:hypothetical protein
VLVETFFHIRGGKNLALKYMLFLSRKRQSQIEEQTVKREIKQK